MSGIVKPLPIGMMIDGWEIRSLFRATLFALIYRVKNQTTGSTAMLKEYAPVGIAHRVDSVVRPLPAFEAEFDHLLKRFGREADVLGQLDLPGVVRTRAQLAGDYGNFLLLEDLGSVTLAKVRRFESSENLRVKCLPFLETLEALHARSFVHGDVTPENVFLLEERGPVLVEFGLSGRIGEVLADDVPWFANRSLAPERIVELATRPMSPAMDVVMAARCLCRALTGADQINGFEIEWILSRHPDNAALLSGIDRALSADVVARPKTIGTLRNDVGWSRPALSNVPEPPEMPLPDSLLRILEAARKREPTRKKPDPHHGNTRLPPPRFPDTDTIHTRLPVRPPSYSAAESFGGFSIEPLPRPPLPDADAVYTRPSVPSPGSREAKPSDAISIEPVPPPVDQSHRSRLEPDNRQIGAAKADVSPAEANRVSGDTRAVDEVDISVFASRDMSAGSEAIIQLFLHAPADENLAVSLAKDADPDAIRRGQSTLVEKIPVGTSLILVAESRGLSIDAPVQRVVWRGRPTGCQFLVTTPNGVAGRQAVTITVLRESVPIGRLAFFLAISAEAAAPAPVFREDVRAIRFRSAFLSYSSRDRVEVIKRAQALRSVGIHCFQDVTSLAPGDRWSERLQRGIEDADLFILFWSHAARTSAEVRKEIDHAMMLHAQRQKPEIRPILLEGPPPPPPPEDLQGMHFDDMLCYVMSALDTLRS